MLARRWLVKAAGLAALVATLGCSGGDGSYATVSGVVTHNGNPVNGATVTFHGTTEVEGERAASYGALTDSSGKYLIAGIGKKPGIPPGMYKVTITQRDSRGVDLSEDFDEGQMEAAGVGRNLLPKDYERLATTKLSVTLELGENKNKDFTLEGKASASRPQGVP